MTEADSTQHYYIATRSSPNDDRARVLKYGGMFAIYDRLGDIQTSGLGEQGIFVDGTRHLSDFRLQLWGARPLLLSSRVGTSNFLFTADLTNLDVSREGQVVIPRGTLHVLRTKFLWRQVCYEQLVFVNHGLLSLAVPVRICFDADFADIFEVRGMHRELRGSRREDVCTQEQMVLSYEGRDRVVRETTIECEPAPQRMSATAAEFNVVLRPKQWTEYRLYVSCDRRSRFSYGEAVVAVHKELGAANSCMPRIYSSNARFNDWVARSMADIQMMVLGNAEPDYPYAGVPWFSTVFGRDGIITALQMLWLNPGLAKGVLSCLASSQADSTNPNNEAEPGKILHEMRKGEMAALGEVPFARYYGSVDATPLFIVLAGAYFEHTGDAEFIKQLWPNVELALEWMDRFGDLDGDGFVEYVAHSPNGLIQQGWKDSSDSVFGADGKIASGPIALCEVQGYAYAARKAAARIAAAFGMKDRALALQKQADELFRRFNEVFWCDDLGTYALALDGDKNPCRVRASNAGHCLYSGIVPEDRARRVADGLVGETFFSGWGIRTVPSTEVRYNPLSYHNGSIWPHDNSIIASGFAKYQLKEFAGRILLAMLDASSMVDLHRLPELFCGLERRPGEGPTLYPVACSPQAWAAGAVFLILQACLGICVDGASNRIVFDRPYLPEGIPQLSLEGWQVGKSSLNLVLERRSDGVLVFVTRKTGDVEVVV